MVNIPELLHDAALTVLKLEYAKTKKEALSGQMVGHFISPIEYQLWRKP